MPIPRFRDSSHNGHTPPFLKTCMLYYIACSRSPKVALDDNQRRVIFEATDRALLDLPSFSPNNDTVLALLILSMAPARPGSRFLRVMDPYNASVLAWNTIKSLGMDQILHDYRADRSANEFFWDQVERLMQLCLVSHLFRVGLDGFDR